MQPWYCHDLYLADNATASVAWQSPSDNNQDER